MENKKQGEQAPEEKDLQERIDGFNKELAPLLGKFELLLAAQPVIMPNGTLAAHAVVVSARPMSKQTEESNKSSLAKPE